MVFDLLSDTYNPTMAISLVSVKPIKNHLSILQMLTIKIKEVINRVRSSKSLS